MGNNLPHELNADNMTNYTQNLEADEAKQDSSTRRKTSASVDEIRNLYSALQELVPNQARPQTTSSYGTIPEETSTSRIAKRERVDTVEYDVASKSSNPSTLPAFKNNPHRCSSPLPLRSQPKVIQRKRSNSCFAISATPNSLAPPRADSLNMGRERRSSNSYTKSQRTSEELFNLIENFDKEKTSRAKSEKNYLRSDSSEVEDSLSKRRHSGGDLLEERREKLKDPKSRMRRRSIGGSLLLNAIIATDYSRQDSLANALDIIARKDELQEIIKNSQENSEQEKNDSDSVGESFDEVDGRPQQQLTQRNPDSLVTWMNENQEAGGNSSTEKEKDSDAKTQAPVGPEMHNLLEALQELVVTGEGTTPPPSSQTSSRRASWVEKSSPKRKESLDELEAFFKNKLDEISEKENDETDSQCVQSQPHIEAMKTLQVKKTEDSNTMKEYSGKSRFRKSSSVERNTGTSSIHRSQSTVAFLSPTHVAKTRSLGTRRASVQIEMNRSNRGRSNSTFEVLPHQKNENHSKNQRKVATRLNNFSSRSRRRKSDIPIIKQEEVLLESTDEDEARKRALWKEDQKVFAKQVNQRLQDWLEKATALSLSTAETTEDESTTQISTDTNPESSKEDNVKTRRAKFAMKKAFQGRIKRSKSLHNILEPEEIVEKPKTRSPLIERSKQNLRKLGRLRISRSKSMHNVADMKPKIDRVETKSIGSDAESTASSSCNVRRSTIWYDDDSSPEMIPKAIAIDISGDNFNTDHLARRRSCPTPNNNFVNNSIDSRRISRLPVDLPLFYAPGIEPSNLRIQKKVKNCEQNLNEKENKMPRISKSLFPVKREMKNELFYNEPKTKTRPFPNTLPRPNIKDSSVPHAKTSCSTTSEEGQFMMFQNYDLSKLSATNGFESFEDFRDRTKSIESEDSGCPNTSDYC